MDIVQTHIVSYAKRFFPCSYCEARTNEAIVSTLKHNDAKASSMECKISTRQVRNTTSNSGCQQEQCVSVGGDLEAAKRRHS
jgi:hypothetical protein